MTNRAFIVVVGNDDIPANFGTKRSVKELPLSFYQGTKEHGSHHFIISLPVSKSSGFIWIRWRYMTFDIATKTATSQKKIRVIAPTLVVSFEFIQLFTIVNLRGMDNGDRW